MQWTPSDYVQVHPTSHAFHNYEYSHCSIQRIYAKPLLVKNFPFLLRMTLCLLYKLFQFPVFFLFRHSQAQGFVSFLMTRSIKCHFFEIEPNKALTSPSRPSHRTSQRKHSRFPYKMRRTSLIFHSPQLIRVPKTPTLREAFAIPVSSPRTFETFAKKSC